MQEQSAQATKPGQPDLDESKKPESKGVHGEGVKEAKVEIKEKTVEEIRLEVAKKVEEIKKKFDLSIEKLKNISAESAQSLIRQSELAKRELDVELVNIERDLAQKESDKSKEVNMLQAKRAYDLAKVELVEVQKEIHSLEAKEKSKKGDADKLKKLTEQQKSLKENISTKKAEIIGLEDDIEKKSGGVDHRHTFNLDDFAKQAEVVSTKSENIVNSHENSMPKVDHVAIELAKEEEKRKELARQKEQELSLWQNINKARSFTELVNALSGREQLKSTDGHIYPTDTVIEVLQLIAKRLPSPKSAIVESFPNIPGVKEKMVALLNKEFFADVSDKYADTHAEMVNKYYGIGGVLRRLVDGKNFQEIKQKDNELLLEMQELRAEAVNERIIRAMDAELFVLDARAESFEKTQGWGKKTYESFKKTGKARMAIGLGLLGGGVALGMAGAPLMVLGGVVGMRRLMGGVGAGVGSYDLLNLAAEKLNMRNLSLNDEKKAELGAFKKENNLGMFSRIFNKEKQKMFSEKEMELKVARVKEILPEMPDEELDKLVTYLGTTLSMDGKKPSQDQTFMELLREKHRRLKSDEFEDSGKLNKMLIREQVKNTGMSKEAIQLKNEKIATIEKQVVDYLKFKYFVEIKLFQEMLNSATTKVERIATPAYKKWTSGIDSLEKMFKSFPEDVQTFIDKHISGPENSYNQKRGTGRRIASADMFLPEIAKKIKEQKTSEIKESELQETNWQFRPEVAQELRNILERNPLINTQAQAEAKQSNNEAVNLIETAIVEIEKNNKKITEALNNKLKEADLALLAREKNEKYMRSLRKVAALGLGVVVASGLVAETLRGMLKSEVVPTRSGVIEGQGSNLGDGRPPVIIDHSKPELITPKPVPVIFPNDGFGQTTSNTFDTLPTETETPKPFGVALPEEHPHADPSDHPHADPVDHPKKSIGPKVVPVQQSGTAVRSVDRFGNIRVGDKPVGFVDNDGFRRFYENSGFNESNTVGETNPTEKFSLKEMKKSVFEKMNGKVSVGDLPEEKISNPVIPSEKEKPDFGLYGEDTHKRTGIDFGENSDEDLEADESAVEDNETETATQNKEEVATNKEIPEEPKRTRLRVREAMLKAQPNLADSAETPTGNQGFVYDPNDLPSPLEDTEPGLKKAGILKENFRRILENKMGTAEGQGQVLDDATKISRLQHALAMADNPETKRQIAGDIAKIVSTGKKVYGDVFGL
ncbi:MAG: hypothetical protein WCT18_00275 [Patescibacteria group bacterium]